MVLMKKVAKIVLVDPANRYLLMYRSNHPTFGTDPDLPGGTLEGDETLRDAMVREVKEEIGLDVSSSLVHEIYSGTNYSAHGTYYALFIALLSARPEVTMSWEHSNYEWLRRNEFIQKSAAANDTYMHMVADVVKRRGLVF